MAASSLLTLIDDIASLLDDVSAMTKVAAQKTAGVLGDDLALNAQQVSGVNADRELPVVWAVAKGSVVNKLILVPGALAISAFLPWAILPLLMMGGAFLCYEGFHKIAHKLLHGAAEDAQHHQELVQAVADPATDIVAFEREKIRGAVRTDLVLSAEIIVIALGTVAEAAFSQRVLVLCTISAVMTVGVYGLVAGIVKLDDAGLYLSRAANAVQRGLGRAVLAFAPWLMKTLSVVGTAAMFMVGGGILVHGLEILHHAVEHAGGVVAVIPGVGALFSALAVALLNALAGVLAGALLVLGLSLGRRLAAVAGWSRSG